MDVSSPPTNRVTLSGGCLAESNFDTKKSNFQLQLFEPNCLQLLFFACFVHTGYIALDQVEGRKRRHKVRVMEPTV